MLALCTDIAARVAQYFEECATDDECEPEERALAIAFSRSAARRGATAHAPDHADSEQDAQLDPDCSDDTWRCKARVDG